MPLSDPNPASRPWLNKLLPLLIVLLSAIHLYRSPTSAAELEVIPDSVEYAVAGHQFATMGKYQIHVNGRALPPRYPPGFSVAFLAPIYAVAPGNIGNGIFAVWIAGIAAGLFAYLIGNKLAGPWAGVFSAILLLHHAQIAMYTQLIMTDVPALALGLIACWIYLTITRRATVLTPEEPGCPSPKEPKALPFYYGAAGIVAALSISIRPLTGLLVLPFLYEIFQRRRNGMWRDILALGLPCAAAIAATSFYQWRAFGDWRRTGYQFWLAVPYDYASLTFSPRYLKDNFDLIRLDRLIWIPILLGVLGALSLWTKRAPAIRPTVRFILLAVVPLSVVHLFYFFTDIRFHFVTLGLLLVLAGAGIAAMIPEKFRHRLLPVLPVLALLILFPRIAISTDPAQKPVRYRVATVAAATLPQNAILISRIDPAYLEQMVVRGTSRRIVPLDRQTPYASAILSYRRIPRLDPPPRNAGDHACIGLVNGGAEKLYAFTADEEISQIQAWVRDGVPVYVELLSTEPEEMSRTEIGRAFRLVPFSSLEPWLVRLQIP